MFYISLLIVGTSYNRTTFSKNLTFDIQTKLVKDLEKSFFNEF